MPWYLALLMPLIERFGAIALKYGLTYLERKYPGAKPLMDLIIAWLDSQKANSLAASELNEKVSAMLETKGGAK